LRKNLLTNNKGQVTVEFAICGLLFIGFVLGMIVIGIWMYNASHVSQAARIAAHNIAVTNNSVESQNMAMEYLNKSLIACPTKGALAYATSTDGFGIAEAYMDPLFPGFQKLIDPRGNSTINGQIHIRREASRVREYRFRPGYANTSN